MTVQSGDSLVIMGDLEIMPRSVLTVESGGYLYVDGDLNNYGSFLLFIVTGDGGGDAVNEGVIAVSGDYNQGPGATVDNGTGDFYVNGSSDVPTDGTIPPEIQNIYDVLPIELKSFDLAFASNAVELNWITVKEENFSHFEIERAVVEGEFELIGSFEGAGDSYSEKVYAWRDFGATYGKNYYRLKAVDKDGSYDYSPIKMIEKPLTGAVSIVPNPAVNLQQVELVLPSELQGKLDRVSLFTIDGKLLHEQTQLDLNSSALSLPTVEAGMYLLKVESNGSTENLRIMV